MCRPPIHGPRGAHCHANIKDRQYDHHDGSEQKTNLVKETYPFPSDWPPKPREDKLKPCLFRNRFHRNDIPQLRLHTTIRASDPLASQLLREFQVRRTISAWNL